MAGPRVLPEYADMSPQERRDGALDEAYFDLPMGNLRSEVLHALRWDCGDIGEAAVRWLARRGIPG